jgi:hypothetical protein
LRGDSGWADIQIPLDVLLFSPALTTLDTAGSPIITIQVGDDYLLVRLLDTAWVTQTVKTGIPGWENTFTCCALASRADGVVWGVFTQYFHYPPSYASGMDLYSFQVRDSEVAVVLVRDHPWGIGAASGCVDRQGLVHSCYTFWPTELCLDQTAIDTTTATRTAVKFDSFDQPQIADTRRDSGLMYCCRTPEVWHVFDLHTGGVAALSLIIGENLQPIIAYTTSDGVFLAHGVDVVGQSEEPEPAAFDSPLTATVARGVLFLSDQPSKARTALFDMTGRCVADLRSGANDVSGLAPSVYFVNEAQTQAYAVRKVIITR